jgi:CubicO group peptidase (beta-lactamase class C family)
MRDRFMEKRYYSLRIGTAVLSMCALPALAVPLDEMAEAIEAGLAGRCHGFGYAIYQNGSYARGGGGGTARKGDPDNQFDIGIPFTEETVKDCHSMSKTITAVALIRALDIAQVSVDSPIWAFLPADLRAAAADTRMQNITFRQLLRHFSGFGASSAFAWADIRTQMQSQLPNAPGSTYVYANWNYAVCRLLIPYLLNGNFFQSLEQNPNTTIAQIDQATADFTINFVRSQVFQPAGLGTIHPRPVDTTLGNFAWYYDFENPSVPGQLMPDRRLTVGSGGWAISATDYAGFLSALFREEIMPQERVDLMMSSELGMFDRSATVGGAEYYTHSGATTGNGVGGRSVWMAFPNDLQVAIQVNSINNAYSAYGSDLDRIVQEAYEKAFATDPATIQYPRHLFVHRAGDGWIASRGMRASGTLGAVNFDYDTFKDGAPALFTHHEFFAVGNQAFLLRYNADHFNGNGRAIMHSINADGTLGGEIFDSDTWLPGYDHVETFTTFQGTFLLLHNKENGLIRTLPVSAFGNLGAAITSQNYTTGFDILEILVLDGQSHLFRHNTNTGETHLRQLNDNGAVGNTVYSGTWSIGFTDFEIFTAGGDTFIFRYNAESGKARINRIDGSLNNTPQVLDQNWSTGWRIIRFVEISGQTWFIRYNPDNGAVRIQAITNGGVPDSNTPLSSEGWLAATVGTGAFDPPTTGWTDIQFYDATPGFSSPGQDLAAFPSLPPIEIGTTIDPVRVVPDNITAVLVVPEQPKLVSIRGIQQMQFVGDKGLVYYIERTTDLENWEALEPVSGDDSLLALPLDPGRVGSAPPIGLFYRVRSIEEIPPLEIRRPLPQ